MSLDETKRCRRCGQEKSRDQFWSGISKDGLHSWCKACCRERHDQWCSENPDRRRELSRRQTVTRYGISEAEYADLLERQGGGCAICSAPPPSAIPGRRAKHLMIDHDHAHCPGQWGCRECIRGLLCLRCNTGAERFGYEGWHEYATAPRPFARQPVT